MAAGRPFLLTRYPVTNSQFAMFIADGGYENEAWWSKEGRRWKAPRPLSAVEPTFWRSAKWNGDNQPNQPVVGVTYWEAEAFAEWARMAAQVVHRATGTQRAQRYRARRMLAEDPRLADFFRT